MTAYNSGNLMNLVTGSLLSGFGLRGEVKSDFTRFALSRNSESFENQLAALIGKDSARNSQARMFNENGFFGARVSNAAELAMESSEPASSVQSNDNSGNTQTIVSNKNEANVRNNDVSRGLRNFSAAAGEYAGRETAHFSISPGTVSNSGSVQRNLATLKSDMGAPILSGDGKAAMAPIRTSGPMTGSVTAELSGKQEPFLSRSPTSSFMSQVEQLKNQSPVKLALKELDSGLKLAVQVKHLTRVQKQALKTELLSLLAQHGLGNYDLQLNNDLFSNQMAPRQEE